MKYLIFLLVACSLSACKTPAKPQPEEVTDLFEKYNLYEADALVIDAFANSDVVLIGENHFIAEHVTFVADLIPTLHANGVNILYSEFISVDYTPLIEEVINAEHFDEQKAKNLLLLNLWDWPYKEYMDLYRSAWEVNRSITDGPKFRIIGLDRPHNYSVMQTPEDWDDPEKRKAFFVDWEDSWAERVLSETVEKNEKALVYCGINHAFTFYNQPILDEDGTFYRMAARDRVGQYLFDALGERCSMLSFHIPWDSKDGETEISVNPLNGRLDQLTDSLSDNQKSYGFYTQTSPLGKVIDSNGFYANGYPNFNLAQFCDGYVVPSKVCDLTMCEFIPNFIDSTNIDIIRPQVKAWHGIENIGADQANHMLEESHRNRIDYYDRNKEKMRCM